MISRRNAIVGAGAAVGVGSATGASALLASDTRHDRLPPDAVMLTRAVLDIHAAHDVPSDVFIAPDFKTGNLIVIKDDLGFCVTGQAIKEGLHLTQFGPCLQGLVKCCDEVKRDPPIRSITGCAPPIRSRMGLMTERTQTV